MRKQSIFLPFIALTAILLIGAACSSNQPTSSTQSIHQSLPGDATIVITDQGFSPSNVTIKAGATVTFINQSSNPSWPASDPHPSHTDLPGFDALHGLNQGEQYSYTFQKVGSWGFHDHLAPFDQGRVIVQ